LTGLYQLTTAACYFHQDLQGEATFSRFIRNVSGPAQLLCGCAAVRSPQGPPGPPPTPVSLSPGFQELPSRVVQQIRRRESGEM